LLRRRELAPSDVRELVFEAIILVAETQRDLDLSLCQNIEKTWQILKDGKFRSVHLSQNRVGAYQMAFGAYQPPSTIVMDSRIPFCDRPLNIPEVPHTLLRYTAVHEVLHVGDHLGGDTLYNGTKKHILSDHADRLERGMEFIEKEGSCDQISDRGNLASLWATQYVDMVTHYRTYVILRERGFPRLDLIWSKMQDGLFPPSMLTEIEREKGTRYVFESIRQVGKYCLIDALMESSSIGDKAACKYAV
jgi:hypothetical protein